MPAALCNYIRLDAGNIRCPNCEHSRKWTRPDTLPKRNCTRLLRQPASREYGLGCIHRGEQTGEQGCRQCGRRGDSVAVFACAKHGQCCESSFDGASGMKAEGIAYCPNCPDFERPPEPEPHPNEGRWWHDQGRVTYTASEPLQVGDRARVLLSFNHGLGDNVFFACVLRQLRRDRPDLSIDVQTHCLNHSLFAGLAGELFCTDPSCGKQPTGHYDLRHSYVWPEPSEAFHDGRSHKLGKTLWEVHGLMPDPALMRYRVPFADSDVAAASDYLDSVSFARHGRFRVVLIHHQGATSRPHKDLPDATVRRLADAVIEAGRVPVVLDWTGESPLLRRSGVQNPPAGHALWKGRKLGPPERIAALASLAELSIGIDSGPGHCFQGAEGARALIVWTRHHPTQFGSPGDGCTHLVPHDHAANAYGPESVWGEFFHREYRHRVYDSLEALPGIITEYLT